MQDVLWEGKKSKVDSYIPLKVNYAGVIPVIFASSLLMFPATLAHSWEAETGLANSPVGSLRQCSAFDFVCHIDYIIYLFLDCDTVPTGSDRF